MIGLVTCGIELFVTHARHLASHVKVYGGDLDLIGVEGGHGLHL